MLLRNLLWFLVPFAQLALAADDFYKLLGVDKSASERDLKTAYRKLSKKFHPDKNPGDEGAHQKFVKIAEAYEVLSDSETRRIYDQFGHEGLKQHQQGGGAGHHHHGDPFDLFSRFFGGGGHFGHAGQRRGRNMEAAIQVPLKGFYTGDKIEFTVEKQQICEDCEGSGSKDGETERCGECGGRGIKVVKHMLAPGIFQQVQTHCDACGGKGSRIKHPCSVCNGARVVRKKVTHTAEVEKGCPNGVRIQFENEADEHPDWVAGDLVISVQELAPDQSKNEDKHDGVWFRRRGNDLVWKEVLSLREALLGGWTRNLTHLDGHEVKLKRNKGETIQPGYIDVIKGEGMPVWQKDGDFGNLLVEYVVVLPDKMESGMRKEVEAVFEKWRKKGGAPNPKDEL